MRTIGLTSAAALLLGMTSAQAAEPFVLGDEALDNVTAGQFNAALTVFFKTDVLLFDLAADGSNLAFAQADAQAIDLFGFQTTETLTYTIAAADSLSSFSSSFSAAAVVP